MAQDLKFELKTVKLPIHSAKHNSQSSGYHEADLRKDDDPKEETKSLTLNTGQEYPNLLGYFSTSRDLESVPETIFRLKSTRHSCL